MLFYNSVAHLNLVRGADGLLYIHDPDNRFPWATHVNIPQVSRSSSRTNQYTNYLGSVTPIEQIGTQALNFIPGVGPILSGIAQAAEAIFGGGDPTPMATLEHETVQLRLQLANLNRQLGIADGFALPAGLDPTNAGEIATLALVIANEYVHDVPGVSLAADTSLQVQHDQLGTKVWGAYTHDERTTLYTAIHAMQARIQNLQLETGNAQLQSSSMIPPPGSGVILPSVSPVAELTPSIPSNATTPDASQAPPAASTSTGEGFTQELGVVGPWALGGTMAVAVLLFAMSQSGSARR